ncbi:CotH kinase family protein [Rheinheimera baltica]|uniref:CotH kinase family protein n=1 Tax=Rheinheimera baltica TaxID=67576 RepID=A0ABT9I4G8_9GAMM|nr:CotH kinase family protein [Rheinheimera baltica]MDP5138283.1 CotH kinase family protein [Rheinheimera baltica]MDP5150434.1 CotH kinase family protein [Rheinheimera baltica]
MKHTKAAFLPLSLLALSLLGCGGTNDDTDTTTGTLPTTTLKINEIVASAADGGNDWIELYALADIADLSQYSIVDDNTDHSPQTLPAVALSAGEFIVIYAIDESDTPAEGQYYVTFKLGSDDAVTLYHNGIQTDQLDWQEGEAAQGYSYGLYTDGSGSAQTLTPTPGAVNQLPDSTAVITDTKTNFDAALRINEIVAKDAAGGQDWIEFYVTGDTAVYLGDYQVADENGERVNLPDITLGAGSFFRVYATTDDLADSPAVGFKLGASDQVSLYLEDDLVDQLSWKTGAALAGYSYGRYPDGSDTLATLTPTAGAANSVASHGPLVINEVVASAFDDGPDWIELYNNSDSPIALNQYQLIDSSDIDPVTLPDVTLAAGEYLVIYATDENPGSYYVPFKLGKEDELSLLLNNETVDYLSWQASDVSAGYSYGLVTDGSWQKNTLAITQGTSNSLPAVYNKTTVESIYFEIDTDQWQDMLDNALDEEYHPTAVTYQGVTLDSVAIRTKGNSSLDSVYRSGGERFSFNIDVNEYVSGQKLLGMKKFVLNNMFNDPSYMREYIAYELMEQMGIATPEHAYVNVYVNGELKGLYLLVEFVNEEFIAKHFSNTQGDLYKPDGVGSDLQWINDDFSSYSGVELKTNEDSSDNGAFINFVREMAFGDALSVIEQDSVLRYMAVSVALSNLDSYHGALAHNYYLYEQDGVFSMLPWDLNESFGSFSMGCNRADIRGLYIDEPTDGALADKPLVANVFADSNNLTTYHGYLQQLIDGPLASANFAARVADIDARIGQHVAADPTAFYSYSQYKTNQTSTVSNFYGLTSFINYRVNNISQQLSGALPSSGTGRGYCSN